MSSGTPEDVTSVDAEASSWTPARWPDDADARRRLEEYLQVRGDRLRDAQPIDPDFGGVEVDLRGARLPDAPLRGAWLNGANLEGVVLRGSRLNGAHLEGSSLRNADLTAATMRDADLSYADATNAVFTDADLYQAEAFATVLRDAQLGGANLTVVLLHEADLRGADLRGATFDEFLTLKRSKLAGARVDGLSGTVLGPIDIAPGDDQILIDGAEMEAWFRTHGAPGITVRR